MNRQFRAMGLAAVAVALLVAPLAFAQQTVELTLDNGGPYTMGGLYVGPYNATENNTQPVQIICDDFQHEVSPGQSWSATVTSVINLTNTTAGLVWSGAGAGGSYLGGVTGNTLQGYLAMAYLASEMLPLSGNNNNATQVGYLAYAIWAVFDAGAVKAWLNNHGEGSIWWQVESLAQGALTAVLNGTVKQSQFAGWELLTPVCPGQGCSNGPPQEFFEFVPEGGSALLYLLLAGASCFGAIVLRCRRQRATASVR